MMRQKSLFVELPGGERLHLRRIWQNPGGEAVLMLHGYIENSRVFYTPSGKGLGPYLAMQGYDVFVAELRGHGLSTPPIGRGTQHGFREYILEDIPAFEAEVRRVTRKRRVHWLAHSYGGVWMAAALGRVPGLLSQVKTLTFLATKRQIAVSNWEKFLMVDLLWSQVADVLVRLVGYLPAKFARLGAENESLTSFREIKAWVRPSDPWLGTADGYDYRSAVQALSLPPLLSLAGAGDAWLGNPQDCQRFLRELQVKKFTYHTLGRAHGNKQDYDHLQILTHPDAVADHFPGIVRHLKGQKF